ncbi:MAG: hypothetical protein ACOVO2_18810 [Emticicia sp.]|uniref:hypothetical protein n=1 Tax=Emticicia sp. TaxID=1930953 RepID=UPI003BA6671F
MKMNLTHTELLSNSDLFNIFGGQDPNKPHGIFQWIGYGIAAAGDAIGKFVDNLPNYQQSSGSSLMNTALH